jgi:deazaflavin-dependent oxidoreductase (nitroreductase family)
MTTHYRQPGFFTKNVANKMMQGVTRMGLSVWGSRVLETKGRKSGQPRRVPVNLLDLDGVKYLVAPRGETDWVRNVRADGGHLALILGRQRSELVGTEITDDVEKIVILREYLRRWKAEVGIFFDGVGPESTEDEIQAIAPRHPVFQLAAA